MLLASLLALTGLAVLAIAADQLVLGSSRLAARSGLNPVVIGVVVIGLGTSAPEFLVSGVAAARGDTGLAIGNLVGSNIVNLTLILGATALVARIRVRTGVVRREIPLAVVAVGVFAALAWHGLDRRSGVVLTVLLAGAIVLLVRWTHDAGAAAPPSPADVARRWWLEGLRALAGLAGVLAGAQLLVTNGAAIAARLAVPQVIIGFTVLALGTSLPELVTSIQAQRRGQTDLVVGNLFGSSLFNSLAGGAIVSLAQRSPAVPPAQPVGMIVMVLTTVLVGPAAPRAAPQPDRRPPAHRRLPGYAAPSARRLTTRPGPAVPVAQPGALTTLVAMTTLGRQVPAQHPRLTNIAPPGTVITITGILHAVSVHDGTVIAALYPDDGGPPLRIADDGRHRQDIVAAVDDIVTLSGTTGSALDGILCLDLHDLRAASTPGCTPAPGPSSRDDDR